MTDQRQPPLPAQSSNKNRSIKIQILPQPFDTEIAYDLVKGLDNELEAMYPDWPDLPHPHFRSGFVGGDKLAGTDDIKYRSNPIPSLHAETGNDTAALNALDADPADPSIEIPPPSSSTTTTTQDPTELTPAQTSKTYFYVAFDLTTNTPQDSYTTAVPQSISTTSKPAHALKPIACIALRLMPYFPHHRAQTPTSTPTPYTSSDHTHTTHAEVKRLYILPSYRGRFKSISLISAFNTPDVTTKDTNVATVLLSQVELWARQTLFVDKLVLETGVRQVPAIKLYESLGWTRIEEFGDYVGAGRKDGGVSMCYEKSLV